MRFLFAVASPEYLRYYDSTMHLLAERGHDVAVTVNHVKEQKQARFDGISDAVRVVGVIPARADRWSALARDIRGTVDFARYLHPRFKDAPVLRDRMKRKALPRAMRWLDRIPSLSEGPLTGVYAVLSQAERGVPVSARLVEFLNRERPNALVVSPLIDAASDQVDLVRAARHLGIRVAVGIASWDNLTNKGLLRVEPDLLLVWNEAQKAEALELHGIPPEKTAVTGAQLFDRWFDRGPSTTRPDFCASVGLPVEEPFLLYTGSSVFIARSEAELPFLRSWLQALRASVVPALRRVAVLVRPHLYNWHAWEKADFTDLGPVQVWPRGPYNAVAEANRNGFFDSMYHSAAVVGVNTSAMIESAIIGRPVFSLTTGFGGTQTGTLHFHHLLPENGGFLRVARSFDEHVAQLSAVLRDPASVEADTRRFVASFVRPHGVNRPCTPIVADVLERFAGGPGRPAARDTAPDLVTRALLRPIAALVNAWPEPRRKPKKRALRKAPVAQAPADAFAVYRDIRDTVARICAADRAPTGAVASPSAYWTEELGNIDYMAEATPLIIAKLRHHAFHVTGLRPYDYRAQDDEKRALFEQRLRTLVAMGGEELVVPEHPALGGFGYDIDGRLFNLDTLKFLEVLVGMKRAGALDAFRRVKGRRIAWEIGGGWGGFAYQFTRLFPETTYVITDLPELFLFSATYLRTVFPTATTLLWGPGLPAPERKRWRDYDFVFVPNTRAEDLPDFKPHLMLNMASFQEMTSAQVAAYAALAARGRCRLCYSLNRERSRYNTELSSVSDVLAAHYDLTDVTPLATDYTRAMKKPSRTRRQLEADEAGAAAARAKLTYRHLFGRLRESGTAREASAAVAVAVAR